jgi:DNA-binding beta-propeller fold protein YncE
MKTLTRTKLLSSIGLILAVVLSSFSLMGSTSTLAQDPPGHVDLIRRMESADTGISRPLGLVFSTGMDAFYILDGKGGKATGLIKMTTTEQRRGAARLAGPIEDPVNMAFDDRGSRLFILQSRGSQLLELKADSSGNISLAQVIRHNIQRYQIKDPQGMAVDPLSGDLFILDADGAQLVRISPDSSGSFGKAGYTRIDLENAPAGLRALAIDPSSSNIHVLSPEARRLYEYSQAGESLDVRALAEFDLRDPQAISFAPSSDQTDESSRMSLYLADGGASLDSTASGSILEFSFIVPQALPSGTPLLPASLVRIIDTSNAAWNPSSPDPAGLDYWPAANRLVVSDSEVEEMPIYFTGKNVFLSSLSGNLTGTCSTTSFSGEPTGVAVNSLNNHIFFTDDGPNDRVFEVSLGPDDIYCTGDDVVNSFHLGNLYNITDAEDVAVGNNTLFIAGGSSAEIYRIPLGANGVMGGGDDGPMTHFDTAAWGFNDMEGIDYNDLNGTLFIVSTKRTDKYLGEVSLAGSLLRAYDLRLMDDMGNIRSDVSYAPSSQNPEIYSIYICSRGIDNDSNSRENDGRIWEISISGSTGPTPTPPPTEPPPTGDLIFADSFESGNFAAWSASRVDARDLSVAPSAALQGALGMRLDIDDTNTIYVTDNSPASEPRYRARFYLDPNSIIMADGSAHFLLNGFMGTSPVLRVEFRSSAGTYQLRGRLLDDSGTWRNTAWVSIADAPNAVELDWRAASGAGANDGGLTLWVDGVQQADLSGVDNDTRRLDMVRFGAVAALDATTTGTFYLDAFESRRQNYIGP